MKTSLQHLQNEDGMATVEAVPLILVFLLLMTYELGMFGVIHSGVMNSMSTRAYMFEIMRNRANVTYFRDEGLAGNSLTHFRIMGNRTSSVQSEAATDNDTDMGIATERPIRVAGGAVESNISTRNDNVTHNEKIFNQALVGPQKRNQLVEVSPVWLQIQYGICLNANCGEE